MKLSCSVLLLALSAEAAAQISQVPTKRPSQDAQCFRLAHWADTRNDIHLSFEGGWHHDEVQFCGKVFFTDSFNVEDICRDNVVFHNMDEEKTVFPADCKAEHERLGKRWPPNFSGKFVNCGWTRHNAYYDYGKWFLYALLNIDHETTALPDYVYEPPHGPSAYRVGFKMTGCPDGAACAGRTVAEALTYMQQQSMDQHEHGRDLMDAHALDWVGWRIHDGDEYCKLPDGTVEVNNNPTRYTDVNVPLRHVEGILEAHFGINVYPVQTFIRWGNPHNTQ